MELQPDVKFHLVNLGNRRLTPGKLELAKKKPSSRLNSHNLLSELHNCQA